MLKRSMHILKKAAHKEAGFFTLVSIYTLAVILIVIAIAIAQDPDGFGICQGSESIGICSRNWIASLAPLFSVILAWLAITRSDEQIRKLEVQNKIASESAEIERLAKARESYNVISKDIATLSNLYNTVQGTAFSLDHRMITPYYGPDDTNEALLAEVKRISDLVYRDLEVVLSAIKTCCSELRVMQFAFISSGLENKLRDNVTIKVSRNASILQTRSVATEIERIFLIQDLNRIWEFIDSPERTIVQTRVMTAIHVANSQLEETRSYLLMRTPDYLRQMVFNEILR